MSGAAYGIASFVDGFVDGRNVKNSWKDRERNIDREKKFDDLKFKQDERSAAEHDRRMKVYDRNDQDWVRAREEEDYWKGVYADAGAATDASMTGGDAPVTEPMGLGGNTTASTSGQESAAKIKDSDASVIDANQTGTNAAQGLSAALQANGMDARHAANAQEAERTFGGAIARNAETTPTIPMQAAAPQPQQGPDFERDGREFQQTLPPKPVPPRDPRDMPPVAAPDPYREGRAELSRMTTNPTAGPGPGPDFERVGRSNPGSLTDQMAVNRMRYEVSPEGKADAAARAEADAAAAREAAFRSGQLRDENLRRVRDEDGPIPLSWRKEADAALAGPNFERQGRGGNPSPAAMGIGPLKSNAPASATPAVQELAQTATDAMADTTTPAMQAAAESAGAEVKPMGVTKGKPVTEKQREKASGDFMDHYMKVGAPMVVEAMLKRGEVDKAIKFQEFLDKNETKAGMKNWSKAAFAASIGDMDTFSDEILEAYNRLDYFGDDTTIVKDASGFTYGKDGEINGAKLTFRDEKTGNTFEQVLADPNDLVRLGITLLAPDQAFEHFYNQETAKSAAAVAQGVKSEAEAKEAAKDRVKRIDDMAKEIFKAKSDPLNPRTDAAGNPLPPMSMEEAQAEAKRIVDGVVQASAPPPVAYRP